MSDIDVVEVYSAADSQEAWLVHAELQNAGIQSRVVGDHLQNAVGDLPAVSIAPRIWVNANDALAAGEVIAKLLEQWKQSRGKAGQSWSCQACEETNEPTFDLCWNCQAARKVS